LRPSESSCAVPTTRTAHLRAILIRAGRLWWPALVANRNASRSAVVATRNASKSAVVATRNASKSAVVTMSAMSALVARASRDSPSASIRVCACVSVKPPGRERRIRLVGVKNCHPSLLLVVSLRRRACCAGEEHRTRAQAD
jgi:hypothetical protein